MIIDVAGYLKHIFSFRGRTGRLGYWSIAIIIGITGYFIQQSVDRLNSENLILDLNTQLTIGLIIFGSIVVIWLNLATTIKRLHDLNKTGWIAAAFFIAIFIPFVNIISALVSFVWLGFFSGTTGANNYGSRHSFIVDEQTPQQDFQSATVNNVTNHYRTDTQPNGKQTGFGRRNNF